MFKVICRLKPSWRCPEILLLAQLGKWGTEFDSSQHLDDRDTSFSPNFYYEKFSNSHKTWIVRKCSKNLHKDNFNILPYLLFISFTLGELLQHTLQAWAFTTSTMHSSPEKEVTICNHSKMTTPHGININAITSSNMDLYLNLPTCPKDPIKFYALLMAVIPV